MAITYFGNVSYPADNGSLAVTTQIITPPASMTAGDLCYVYGYRRIGANGFSISQTGGQTWTDLGQSASNLFNANGMAHFWCVFNGTWTGNLEITFPGVSNTTAMMMVFRPTSTSYTFGLDTAASYYTGAGTVCTITGLTPANNNNVSIATWGSSDDNTYGTLTGTNWSKTSLPAQVRNLAGTDSSTTFAYQIQGTKGATNNVSQTQLTLGGDNTIMSIVTFYEYIPVAPSENPQFFSILGM